MAREVSRPAKGGEPQGFLEWIAGSSPDWEREWAKAIRRDIGAYKGIAENDLKEYIGRHVEALLSYWRDGSEAALLDFYSELALQRARQHIKLSDVVLAVSMGRRLLMRRMKKVQAADAEMWRTRARETFDAFTYHLLRRYEDAVEKVAAETQAKLKETEEASTRYQENWTLLDQILTASVSAILATDLEGRVTLINRTAERLLGFKESDLLDRPVVPLYAGGVEEARRVMAVLMRGENLVDYETSLLDSEGEKIPVLLTGSLLKDEVGRAIGTMGFVQDLRTEKALRREVAAREARLLAILQGSLDGLVVLDTEDRVVLWNRGAAMLLGVKEKEAIGRPISTFLPPEVIHELPVQSGTEHSGTARFEARLQRGRGRPKDLLVTRTDMPGQPGGTGGASLVLKDITEVKHLQRELAQAEHLAGLGRLSASVAHEIKNPIAGLRGAMEMISQIHKPGDPRFAIFQEALAQIRRLDTLVKDLLAYAKPVSLATEPVPVELLIETALPMIKDSLKESEVSFEARVPRDIPAAKVDPQQIRQVFVNLMQNAIQAMEKGGTLTVSAHPLEGEVSIDFSDTGCGIAEEDIVHIFQPFYTTKHIGTGLGLSIVQRILSAHGGRCEVKSAPGAGSTFSAILPTG